MYIKLNKTTVKKLNPENMRLDKKLSISFVAIIILFIIPVFVSLLKFSETIKFLKEINNITIPQIYTASTVSMNLKEIEKNLYASTLTDNTTKKTKYISYSNDLYEKTVVSLNELRSASSESSSHVDKILELFLKEAEIRNEIMNSKYKSDASRIIFNSYEPIVNEINLNLNMLTDNINRALQEKTIERDRTVGFSITLSVFTYLATVVLALFISKTITSSITKPLTQIENLAMALAEGRLDYKITYESGNEIGGLAKLLKKSTASLAKYIHEIDAVMKQLSDGNLIINTAGQFKGDFRKIGASIEASADMLAKTMKNINQLSSEVSSCSNKILLSSTDISNGADEQSISVEIAYAAIKNISSYISTNTESTYDAENRLLGIDSEIACCSRKMNEMVDAMSEISAKSKEIEKIIKIIDNITLQTNILALNAAVEAAHAGSSGKGLSVIADEVRSLAETSSESAKNISALIEDSINAVFKGKEIADETSLSLSKVSLGTNDVYTRVKEISSISGEQLAAIENIKSVIGHISNVVSINSSASKQLYADSHEMSSGAQELHNMVSKFVF